jgi:putative Mg2+ transporter-C (MgtC) family protein
MGHQDLVLLGRVALAFALCFVIGFEREIRGSAAGDRTYAMVGLAAAAVAAVAERISPQAIAGVITGVGFIGGGLVYRQGTHNIKGITSAATILAVASIGVVAGTGHAVLAIVVAALVLVDLEVRNLPGLRRLDARRYVGMIRDDLAPPMSAKVKADEANPTQSQGSAP